MKKTSPIILSGDFSAFTRIFSTSPKIFICCLLLLGALGLTAQTRHRVTGVIKDDKGLPTPNVTVSIKGGKAGAATDPSGVFQIDAPSPQSVLVVSYVGYQTQEIPINNRTQLDVALVAGTSQMDAVVVVGYGVQKKVTITGSVASVKGADLEKSPNVNLSNSLGGRLPGVTAIQASGEPGRDGSTIRIRGTNTLGNSSALIVIDGIPDRAGGLERLNPSNIESMSVLKDAAAAIYGARAANGVILITTKQGKTGKPVITYDFNRGWAQPTRVPKVANATQYTELLNEQTLFSSIPASQWGAAWEAFKSTGTYTRTDNGVKVNAPFQPADIQKFKDGSDPWGHPNTDWFKDALKTWSPQERHDLQVSGGSETIKLLASAGYQNQDAFYKNSATGYKQYDLRINLDAKVNKYITANLGITAREEYRFYPTQTAGAIFRMLMRGKPTEPEIWPNGLPGPDIENGQNPVVITTNATGSDKDRRDYFQSNGRIDITNPWIKGLKLSLSGAADKMIRRVKRFETPWSLYYWDKKTYEADGTTPLLTRSVRSTFTDPRLTQVDESELRINLTGILSYDTKFGDNHTLTLLAGVTKETREGDNFSAFRRYFISPVVDQFLAGGTLEQNISNTTNITPINNTTSDPVAIFGKQARLSYFGRVAYNYQEKYLAEFLWRYDGSYIFPENKRFGFFPGILGGWNISKERFFEQNVRFINYLKLRGSYGQMGNDLVTFNNILQEYAYLPSYSISGTQVIGSSVRRTLSEVRVPNLDFTWEVANNADVGLEGSLFNSRITFEFDYFYNKRTNILIRKQGSTPQSSGISTLLPPVNLGRVDNKGYELKLGYNGSAGDFNYSIGVNGGYAKNKVVFWDESPGVMPWQRATGHSVGSSGYNFLSYVYDGVFRDEKEIAANKVNYSAATGTLLPGDMKFKDIDKNDTINSFDQIRLDKNRDPTFTYGITMNFQYKNFDLSLLFQGATGGLLLFNVYETGDFGNYLEYSYKNRWSVENPSSVDPRLANRGNTYFTNNGQNFGSNTYFLRPSDYFRLKNIELGYNLGDIGSRIGLSRFRLFANALNLVTWDKMKIWDPESTSSSGQYYPQSRIINTGLRLTF